MFKRFLANFYIYIIAGLLVTSGVSTIGWLITDANLDSCQSGRKADKEAYKRAQADAELLAAKAIADKEKEYVAKAKKADADYGALSAKYNESIRLYIDAQGKARRASPAPGSGGAESSNRPGENPFVSPTDYAQTELSTTEVAVVPVSDLVICGENTARLVVARDWALGLNK